MPERLEIGRAFLPATKLIIRDRGRRGGRGVLWCAMLVDCIARAVNASMCCESIDAPAARGTTCFGALEGRDQPIDRQTGGLINRVKS